jgi:KDO2-lipid IV(A) lauroyltransferase
MSTVAKFIIWLLSLMPAGMPYWLASKGAGLWMYFSPVKRKTTVRNLERCYPDMSPEEREGVVRESFVHYLCLVLETGHNWYWSPERLYARCDEVVNGELLAGGHANGQGVVVLAPHFGAWEYFGIHLQKIPGMTILYKPLSHPGLEKALQDRRGRGGGKVLPATASGLRQLYARLRAGNTIGVLPDQHPSSGKGRFAPFFGYPALTGVLVPRMVQRTNCIVVAGVTERLPGGRYRVHFVPVDDAIHSDDMDISLAAMNRAVEDCIAINPPQYLWSYRRFKTQPEGLPDFYADDPE